MLFVISVTFLTYGYQQVAAALCKMIGRAASSGNLLSISQTICFRLFLSVSADC